MYSLRRRPRARVRNVLNVEAELVGVVAADLRQVVVDLQHVLREREAGVSRAGHRATEVGDVGNRDRRTAARFASLARDPAREWRTERAAR